MHLWCYYDLKNDDDVCDDDFFFQSINFEAPWQYLDII